MRTMIAILRRLWPRRRATASIAMGVHVVVVPKPIPLKEREPGADDMDAIDACCWWGDWYVGHWIWVWASRPPRGEAYWLPASVEVLPARCCPPEVES